jgi:hypothetical protein
LFFVLLCKEWYYYFCWILFFGQIAWNSLFRVNKWEYQVQIPTFFCVKKKVEVSGFEPQSLYTLCNVPYQLSYAHGDAGFIFLSYMILILFLCYYFFWWTYYFFVGKSFPAVIKAHSNTQ